MNFLVLKSLQFQKVSNGFSMGFQRGFQRNFQKGFQSWSFFFKFFFFSKKSNKKSKVFFFSQRVFVFVFDDFFFQRCHVFFWQSWETTQHVYKCAVHNGWCELFSRDPTWAQDVCVREECHCRVYCNKLWCGQRCNNITRVQQARLLASRGCVRFARRPSLHWENFQKNLLFSESKSFFWVKKCFWVQKFFELEKVFENLKKFFWTWKFFELEVFWT